jgi:microcystin-dependent protein
MQKVPPLGADPGDPFVDRNLLGGIEGSVVPAAFFNVINDELVHLIEHAGLTPDDEDLQQIRKAVAALIASAVPAGMVAWFAATAAPTGYVKANGALLSRAAYPALWLHAQGSGNLVNEATWSATSSGAYSTGDLATTFRIPDMRGEFPRAWDDGRGVDTGRAIGTRQAQAIQQHLHALPSAILRATGIGTLTASAGTFIQLDEILSTQNTGGTETRPRNVPLLACIKF